MTELETSVAVEPAGIGHNAPPEDMLIAEARERVETDLADIIEKVATIKAKVDAVKDRLDIKLPEDAAKTTDLVGALKALSDRLKGKAGIATSAYETELRCVAAGKAIIGNIEADIKATTEILRDALKDYLDRQPEDAREVRGEYGASAGLSKSWEAKDVVYAALDLKALRPFLSEDALDKALRGFIRAGGRKIKGATIYEATRLTVR